MKNPFLIIILLTSFHLFAQPNTEVYLTDLTTIDGKTTLTNLRNISHNQGYDNQPSFYDANTILFASTRNEQTDIAKYDIVSGTVSWITDTPGGSEYSPLRIPNSEHISAVRLDTTGYQRLNQYNVSSGNFKEIRKDAKVGYHVWYSENILVNTILVADGMDLVVSNFEDETNYTVQKNVGRSLHKIPNTDLVSYIAKDQDTWFVKSLHPITGATTVITKLPPKTEDICWLPDGNMLVPVENLIYKFKPESSEDPDTINLSDQKELNSISRIAVSLDGKHLALVAQEPPSKIVQKQVDSFNAGNLDAFINCYSENVVVRHFGAGTLYMGHEKMRDNYSGLSPENKVHDVEVVNRITIGNKVIDHEKVMRNGTFEQMQVAIYEVSNTIDSMTFIFDNVDAPNPETIVQKKLGFYHKRDIDGFLETFNEDAATFNFPAEKRFQGLTEIRSGYTRFFESTPDLNCEIKNRIVIGNIVIDEEHITANETNFSAVAVYEVENGKISKVTFIQ